MLATILALTFIDSILLYATPQNAAIAVFVITTGLTYVVSIASALANKFPENQTLHWLALNGEKVRISLVTIEETVEQVRSGPHAPVPAPPVALPASKPSDFLK